mgnify:CR=1 FL=1
MYYIELVKSIFYLFDKNCSFSIHFSISVYAYQSPWISYYKKRAWELLNITLFEALDCPKLSNRQ